jgi:hypothetical protein
VAWQMGRRYEPKSDIGQVVDLFRVESLEVFVQQPQTQSQSQSHELLLRMDIEAAFCAGAWLSVIVMSYAVIRRDAATHRDRRLCGEGARPGASNPFATRSPATVRPFRRLGVEKLLARPHPAHKLDGTASPTIRWAEHTRPYLRTLVGEVG